MLVWIYAFIFSSSVAHILPLDDVFHIFQIQVYEFRFWILLGVVVVCLLNFLHRYSKPVYLFVATVSGSLWAVLHTAYPAHQNESIKPPAHHDFVLKNIIHTNESKKILILSKSSIIVTGGLEKNKTLTCSRSNILFQIKKNQCWAKRDKKTLWFELSGYPYYVTNILNGMLLGRMGHVSRDVVTLFKKTGTVHMLVASGMHFAVWIGTLGFIITCIFRLPFCLKIISSRTYLKFEWIQMVLVLSFTLLASLYLGWSTSAQRVCLLLLAERFLYCSGRCPSFIQRILISAALQILLFPIGFLSNSTLMSWMAFLLCATSFVGEEPMEKQIRNERRFVSWAALRRCVRIYLSLNILISLCSWAIFGNSPIVSFVCNSITVPFLAPTMVILSLSFLMLRVENEAWMFFEWILAQGIEFNVTLADGINFYCNDLNNNRVSGIFMIYVIVIIHGRIKQMGGVS